MPGTYCKQWPIPSPSSQSWPPTASTRFVTVMLSRDLKQQPGNWTGQSLHLHSTEGKGEWVITLGPDSAVSVEHVHRKGDVALQGTASSLYLWCLNRIPSTELTVFGDRAVADQWTTEIAL